MVDRATDGPRPGWPWPRRRSRLAAAEGATQAEALVIGGRLGADPVRQQRDPPERRRDERAAQPPLRRRRAGSAWRRPAGSIARGCARSPRRAGRIARNVEENDEFVSLPGPDPADPGPAGGAYAAGTAEAIAGAARRGCPRGHRRRRRRRRRRPSARSPRRPRRSPSPTRSGVRAAGERTTLAADRRRDGRRTAARATPRRRPSTRRRIDAAGARSRGGRRRRGRRANAVSVEPGDYPVVLEEYAVVDILDMLGYLGFSALAVQEGRSFAEPGRRVGSDLVTIWDDGADPLGAADGLRLRGRRQAAACRSSSAASAATSCTTPRPPRGPASSRPATACPRRTRTARSR